MRIRAAAVRRPYRADAMMRADARPTEPAVSMHSEFDPDDNFAHSFGGEADVDEDAATEALVWQLLLLINPDDEAAALEQFARWQELFAERAGEDDLAALLHEAIDWRAGFRVADDDVRGLVESLDELAARWNLRIDWGLDDDAEDGDALDGADVESLINTAFDRLREHHYTLWTRETGEDTHAGWITRSRDDEALRLVATALGLHVRAGAG